MKKTILFLIIALNFHFCQAQKEKETTQVPNTSSWKVPSFPTSTGQAGGDLGEAFLLQQLLRQRDAEALNLKTIYTLPATLFDYTLGQINENVLDHNLQVVQPLGDIFLKREKTAIVNSKLQSIDNQMIILKKRLYFDFMGLENEHSLILKEIEFWKQQDEYYQQVLPRMELRFKNGEINILEYQFFKNSYRQLQKEATDKQLIYLDWQKRRTQFLGKEVIDTVKNAQIQRIFLNLKEKKELHASFLADFSIQNQLLTNENALNLKAYKTPSVEVGYFAQSLNKSFLFQGVRAVVAMPLDKRAANIKSEQYAIAQKSNEAQSSYTQRQLQAQLNSDYQQLELLDKQLSQFDTSFFNQLPAQKTLLRQQLSQGEIDFMRYQQLQTSLQETELSYYRLLHDWNKLVLEVQYLTN
jgi:heavy metal efflux system protein